MTRELTSEPPSNVRCVGEREFPGEGICYVYEDGSHCRKVIDGEVVNPNWRTTKAGKARKRQPLACMACRRKKIKCEPGDPSCVSCEKSNQVCRVSRIHEVSIEARPTVSREQTASSPVKRALAIAGRYPTLDDASRSDARKRRRSQEHKTQSPTLSPAREQPVASSFMTDSPKLIRPRSPVISWGMVTGEAKDDTTDYRSKSSADTPKIEPLGTVSNVVNEHRKTDPYNVDPELTLYLLDLYFTHINSATYCMFPPKTFRHWVVHNRRKSQNELMVLYACLAMGSIFADTKGSGCGRHFAEIATFAVARKQGRFSLELAQSRLMLALYNFARGKDGLAWDHCGSALRALSALKLNSEDGVMDIPDSLNGELLGFGLDRIKMIECRRRTFWSGVLMDRYNGFCAGTLCVVHIEDIFLRLPCSREAYEEGRKAVTPYFDNPELDPELTRHNPASPLSPMAYLALISAIWGDVLAVTHRAVHRPSSTYAATYDSFYAKAVARVEAWTALLPPHLRYSPENTARSIRDGYAGTFISLHALYHVTLMKLNRHARPAVLPLATIRRNIRAANHHALQLLDLMHVLSTSSPSSPSTALQQRSATEAPPAPTIPFAGYAILTAVDILSAGGPTATLAATIDAIATSLASLTQLATFWASARAQQKSVEQRLADILAASNDQGLGARSS
ncbi:hypothetical protein LTR39_003942, partial [Cryomyces antarcticus]